LQFKTKKNTFTVSFVIIFGTISLRVARCNSEEIGHHLVGHSAAVLLPGSGVFLAALGVVAERAMDQQTGQVDGVRVGHQVVEQSRDGPEER